MVPTAILNNVCRQVVYDTTEKVTVADINHQLFFLIFACSQSCFRASCPNLKLTVVFNSVFYKNVMPNFKRKLTIKSDCRYSLLNLMENRSIILLFYTFTKLSGSHTVVKSQSQYVVIGQQQNQHLILECPISRHQTNC